MVDWPGLLRWSISMQEDASNATRAEPMSEERKQFLESALKSLYQDIGAQLEVILKVLRQREDGDAAGSTDGDPAERKMVALEELQDMIDNIDVANDFVKMGGFEVLLETFYSPNNEVVAMAVENVALLIQNNPKGQAEAIRLDVMGKLVDLLHRNHESAVQAKCVLAISGLVRNCADTLSSFTSLKGLSLLLKVLTNEDTHVRVKTKILFFLIYLLSSPAAGMFEEENMTSSILPATLTCFRIEGDDTLDAQARSTALDLFLALANNPRLLPYVQACGVSEAIADRQRRLAGPELADDEDVADELQKLQSLGQVLSQ